MSHTARASAKSPREFSLAMRDLVERSQRHPATAVSEDAFQMKLRVLDYFVQRGPGPDVFEKALLDRIEDPDPEKELSKGICSQIFNCWRSGNYYYDPEGKLVLRALYPAERPLPPDGDDS